MTRISKTRALAAATGNFDTESAFEAPATAAIEAIVAAVTGRIQDPAVLIWAWPRVEEAILGFDPHVGTDLFPGVSPDIVAAFFETLERSRVEQALHVALATALARLKNPSVGLDAVAAAVSLAAGGTLGEWNQLSAFVRANIIGGFAGFQNVRTGLFTKFGAAGNPGKAIPRVNAYYQQLTAAGFPKKKFSSPVHPELKARLDKAAALITAKGSASALDAIKSVGGFANRPNVNSPSQLSNHSFGWAVDIDPELNPNIKKKKLPLDVIQAMTGIDLYGAESTTMRTPAPYDALLPAATAMSRASSDFRAAFRSADGLKAGIANAVQRLSGIALAAADLDRAHALATAQPGKLADLTALLGGLGVAPAKAKATATVLVAAGELFRRAQAVSRPEIIGSDATVARFGFFNLAPEVAAGLVASDGGGLRWLGSATATKDFMHFELMADDQPKLF